MHFIAEASVFSVLLATIATGLFVLYLRYGRGAERRIALGAEGDETLPPLSLLIVGGVYVGLLAAELLALFAASTQPQWVPLVILVVALALAACVYFPLISPLINDRAVRYTAMLWLCLMVICIIMLTALSATEFRVERGDSDFNAKEVLDIVGPLATFLGIIVAALGVVLASRFGEDLSRRSAAQEIYQRLELAALELFRYDIEHPALVKALWFPDHPDAPQPRKAEDVELHNFNMEQYVCQLLNLFEMAYRFRKEGIVPADVYASWIIWMYEVCELRQFQKYWSNHDIAPHYIPDFRRLMDYGIFISGYGTLPDDVDSPAYDQAWHLRAYGFYEATASSVSPERPCRIARDWLHAAGIIDRRVATEWFKAERMPRLAAFKPPHYFRRGRPTSPAHST